MSKYGRKARSYEIIDRSDLSRLLTIAQADIDDFFRRHQDWAELYCDRFLGFALCQGAANHYIGRGDGVQDFDVYAFFAQNPKRRWRCYRRRGQRDFGSPKFGRSPDNPGFIGRRVDVLTRALDCAPETDLGTAIQTYLRDARTVTARELANKAVVLLTPPRRLGAMAWPMRS